jgi:hypothetical protein
MKYCFIFIRSLLLRNIWLFALGFYLLFRSSKAAKLREESLFNRPRNFKILNNNSTVVARKIVLHFSLLLVKERHSFCFISSS